MQSVAVIGLGQMGLGMATTLARKGFTVTGHDLAEARMAQAHAAGLTTGLATSRTAAEAARGADVIVLSLPLAAHVEAVVRDALIGAARPGAVIVDTSTSEAAVSRALAGACAAKGLGFLDAPVSGGPSGAASGALTFMIGGADADLAAARPTLEAMGAKLIHVGASGAGNVAKLANNLLVAAHLLTVSEAVRMAEAAGVPSQDVLKGINAASGRSAVSEVNYPRWIASGSFDSGFTMGLMRKDVRLAQALGEAVGALGPMSALAARLWADSAAQLADGEDFNRIVTLAPATETDA
jgi:3-hydroxyisobutyrate dehydrogenase